MKTLALAAALAIVVQPALAGDPTGVWQSQKDEDGDWIDLAIVPCGEKLCGQIAEVYGGNPDNKGLTIIEGMTRVGTTAWSEGRIYAVNEDTWYDSRMELVSPDRLRVSGCIGYGLLCESQTLSRRK